MKSGVRRLAARAHGMTAWMRSVSNRIRIMKRDFVESRDSARDAKRSPTLAERRAELTEFYGRYEDLVDVLCAAAQYGPDGKLESRYQEIKIWMQARYPALRRSIVAFLRYDPADARNAIDLHGLPGDAFEALFAAPTVEDFLRCDDGHMIERIERTRDALQRYGDHLRHEAR